MKRFQEPFPEITYDMDLEVELANAQAFRVGGQQHVRLYGGLVRHRQIGSAGIAFVLAHETGHHHGGAPFMQFQPKLSSEVRATAWATTVGLQKVFGRDAADLIVQRGVAQLRVIGLVE